MSRSSLPNAERAPVELPGPTALVPRVLAALASRTPPVAVLDPTWPASVRDAAVAALQTARDDARLADGDLVLFTSGSSGRAKGVLRTSASWAASLAPLSSLTGLSDADVVWLPLPLSFGLSLYGAVHSAWCGAGRVSTTSTAPVPAHATVAHLVPTLLDRVCADVEAGAPSSLHTVVVAGAACPMPVRTRAERLGWRVLEYYGAAELSFVAWRDDAGPLRAFPGADLAVRDGELWVRSAYLSTGYLDDQPSAALRRDGRWATVGDRARPVPGGLQITGRGDSAVTVGGVTVLVEEVETALAGWPGVLDIVLVGAPHPTLGQVPVAVVVLAPGVTRADLERAAGHLPRTQRPRRWFAVPRIPRTASGKPARAEALALTAVVAPLR